MCQNQPIMTTNKTTSLSGYENESELLRCLQSGDQQDFTKLYDWFSGAIFGIILRWINDKGAAENLLQDVFVKAWKNKALYDASKGRIFTWLYNITRHQCIDYLRSKAYKQSRLAILDDIHQGLLPARNTDMILADAIGLRKLVHNLKEEYKVLVELSYFQGYTQDEIAKMLNMPLGTVKTRLRTALIQLREIIKP